MTIVCFSEKSVAWRCSFVWQISLVLMFQYWHPLGDAAACKWWQECWSTSGNLMNHIKWPYGNQYKIITQRKGSSRMRLHKTVLGIYGFDELSCFNTWNPGAKSVNLLGLLSAKPKWICSPGNIYGVISLVIHHQLSHKIFTTFCFKILHPNLINLAIASRQGHVIAGVWWNDTVDRKSCTRWPVVCPTICNTSQRQDLSMLVNSSREPLPNVLSSWESPTFEHVNLNRWLSSSAGCFKETASDALSSL